MVDTPAVEEPTSPDTSRVNPATKRTWFGHPRQLARLFTTEMWERFGYYGMRALLTLYLTKHFVLGDHASTGLYGGYTPPGYPTPPIGRLLAPPDLRSQRPGEVGADPVAVRPPTPGLRRPPAQPFAAGRGQP